jgi:hypothetical protein
MYINYKNEVMLKNIEVSEAFVYESSVYMRIKQDDTKPSIRVVNLETGDILYLGTNQRVRKYGDIEITVL